MANQLKVATVHSILTLWERGWSQRRTARTLRIDRGTVARYIKLGTAGCGPPREDSKPAKPAHGSHHSEPAHRAEATPPDVA